MLQVKTRIDYQLGTGTSCREIFKLESWSPGVGSFPIETINLLSLKRRRDSDFKNFVIMKRER